MIENYKLFACLVGGQPNGFKLECHDMYFFVAEKVEDCYDKMIQDWNGRFPKYQDAVTGKIHNRIHLDGYQELNIIDGYKINIVENTEQDNNSSINNVAEKPKLFMIHLGGYQHHHLNEFHEQGFVVGHNLQEARQKAKNLAFSKPEFYHQNFEGTTAPHTDNCMDIEEIIDIESTLLISNTNSNLSIILTKVNDVDVSNHLLNPITITGYQLLN